ncbi:hypothetical protein C0J52_13562 [Blattella germanica]|nr:hypothetical protein C0J52_13562 [Blattella germanica]
MNNCGGFLKTLVKRQYLKHFMQHVGLMTKYATDYVETEFFYFHLHLGHIRDGEAVPEVESVCVEVLSHGEILAYDEVVRLCSRVWEPRDPTQVLVVRIWRRVPEETRASLMFEVNPQLDHSPGRPHACVFLVKIVNGIETRLEKVSQIGCVGYSGESSAVVPVEAESSVESELKQRLTEHTEAIVEGNEDNGARVHEAPRPVHLVVAGTHKEPSAVDVDENWLQTLSFTNGRREDVDEETVLFPCVQVVGEECHLRCCRRHADGISNALPLLGLLRRLQIRHQITVGAFPLVQNTYLVAHKKKSGAVRSGDRSGHWTSLNREIRPPGKESRRTALGFLAVMTISIRGASEPEHAVDTS